MSLWLEVHWRLRPKFRRNCLELCYHKWYTLNTGKFGGLAVHAMTTKLQSANISLQSSLNPPIFFISATLDQTAKDYWSVCTNVSMQYTLLNAHAHNYIVKNCLIIWYWENVELSCGQLHKWHCIHVRRLIQCGRSLSLSMSYII